MNIFCFTCSNASMAVLFVVHDDCVKHESSSNLLTPRPRDGLLEGKQCPWSIFRPPFQPTNGISHPYHSFPSHRGLVPTPCVVHTFTHSANRHAASRPPPTLLPRLAQSSAMLFNFFRDLASDDTSARNRFTWDAERDDDRLLEPAVKPTEEHHPSPENVLSNTQPRHLRFVSRTISPYPTVDLPHFLKLQVHNVPLDITFTPHIQGLVEPIHSVLISEWLREIQPHRNQRWDTVPDFKPPRQRNMDLEIGLLDACFHTYLCRSQWLGGRTIVPDYTDWKCDMYVILESSTNLDWRTCD